jgi:hypothetical protein
MISFTCQKDMLGSNQLGFDASTIDCLALDSLSNGGLIFGVFSFVEF